MWNSVDHSDEARWERFGDFEAFPASLHFDLAQDLAIVVVNLIFVLLNIYNKKDVMQLEEIRFNIAVFSHQVLME